MRDRYQPGHELVLPSGRRVRIHKVLGDLLRCHYIGRATRGMAAGELDLVRHFCDRHCLLVEVATA